MIRQRNRTQSRARAFPATGFTPVVQRLPAILRLYELRLAHKPPDHRVYPGGRGFSLTKSTDNSLRHLTMHIRQSIAAALEFVSELFMVYPKQLHDRGVQIMNVQSVGRHIVTELTR